MPDLPDTLYTRTLRALQDVTACPACTATLRAGRCGACGLDVSGPDGVLVWQDSQAVVRALTTRQQRVAAMRAAQARQGTGTVPTRPPAAARPATAAGPPPTPPRRPTGTTTPPPSTPPASRTLPVAPPAAPGSAAPGSAVPAAGAPARRPWRVQTVLQVVGAALLVAASVTFLVFAWDVMGLRARAAVVGVGTLVVFALASWMRARRLPQGAEAVGTVAVVLLLLDAWALRATGVVVQGDGTGQAGVSALVCAGLLTVWGVRSRLRVGTVAAAALVPLAPLAWVPAAPDAAGVGALLLVSGVLAAARAVPPFAHGRAERAVLRVAAALALGAAALTASAATVARLGTDPWEHLALLTALVAVLVLQVAVEARTVDLGSRARPPWTSPGATAMRTAWAAAVGVTTALTAAGAVAALAAPSADQLTTSQAAVVGACLAAVGLLLVPRAHDGDPDVRVAARAGLLVAAAAATWAALVLTVATVARLLPDPSRAPAVDAGTAAAGALLVAGALAVLAARRADGRPARAAALGWRAAAVLVAVTAPVLVAAGPVGALVLVGGEAVVAGAFVAAARGRLGPVAARTGAVVATVLAVLGAAPHPGWTAAALLLGAALAVHARSWSTSARSAPSSTLAAAALVLAAGATGGATFELPSSGALGLTLAPVAAALLVRARVVGARRAGAAERDAALGGLAVALGIAWPAAAAALDTAARLGDPSPAPLVHAAPLVVAATALSLVVVLLRAGRTWGAAHVASGASAAAPVGGFTVATLHAVAGMPDHAASAVLITVLGVVSLVTAPLLRPTGGALARHCAEVAGVVVVAAGVAVGAGAGPGPVAVVLLVAAVGAGAWALTPGRHHAWWVALALGTSSWWVLLVAQEATVVEPYTLPPALAVAAVGAWRVARRRAGAATLLVAGLTLATVPTAVLPAVLELGPRWVDRGLLTAGSSVAVVVAALLLRRRRPAAADLLAGLGALLVLAGPLQRALTLAVTPGAVPTGPLLPDGTGLVEMWSWPAAVAWGACALVVRTPRARTVLDRAAPWALLAATAGPTLLAVVVAPGAASAPVRAGAAGIVATALALAGAATGRRVRPPGARTVPGGPRTGVALTGPGLVLAGAAAASTTAVVLWHAPLTVLGPVHDLPALVAGLVALAAVALTARRDDVPLVWVVAGALALAPSLLARSTDLRLVLWGLTAAVLLGLAAVAHRTAAVPRPDGSSPRSRPDRVAAADVPRVLTAAALAVAVAGPWASAVGSALSAGTPSPVRVELVAVLTWLVALRHARTWRPGPVGAASLTVLVAILAVPLTLAVDASVLGTARGALVLAGGTALAWRLAGRTGTALGLGTATLATAALALRGGPEPPDVPWTVLGLVALVLGVRRMLQGADRTSWRTLGPPLALTLGAPFAMLVVDPAGWRVVTLLALGVAAVVVGAVRRWQAPFLLGAAGVLATLVVVLSPVAADALAAVDGWVLLAVGGALVLGLGVTYERRVQQAREAVRFVGEMR
ncbi:SCO7613 C-terminal domain-containing membrane protein [Cellulomonas phragmiteti]|nr:hypothetical protein [Cellulomonas phragmiteti]